MDYFDHEKLELYRVAIAFVALSESIIDNLPRGKSSLSQQLYRAAASIPLNIAEGAGEFAPKEKARFYRIARRSATESAAILDVCLTLALVERDLFQQARKLLLRVVSMLVRLVKNCCA